MEKRLQAALTAFGRKDQRDTFYGNTQTDVVLDIRETWVGEGVQSCVGRCYLMGGTTRFLTLCLFLATLSISQDLPLALF